MKLPRDKLRQALIRGGLQLKFMHSTHPLFVPMGLHNSPGTNVCCAYTHMKTYLLIVRQITALCLAGTLYMLSGCDDEANVQTLQHPAAVAPAEQPKANQEKSQEIVDLLNKTAYLELEVPPEVFEPPQDKFFPDFLNVCIQIAKQYESSEIEVAIGAMERDTEDPDTDWARLVKLYVLNRVVCDVPEWVDVRNLTNFGGWTDVPVEGTRINAIWPLSIDGHGHLVLKQMSPGYMGPPYFAAEEFRYFLRRFGRREFVDQ